MWLAPGAGPDERSEGVQEMPRRRLTVRPVSTAPEDPSWSMSASGPDLDLDPAPSCIHSGQPRCRNFVVEEQVADFIYGVPPFPRVMSHSTTYDDR